MSRIEREHGGAARRMLALHELYQPREAKVALPDGDALYRYAASRIGIDTVMTYLEFGVSGGASFGKMLELFANPRSTFVGFDSFAGLPEAFVMFEPGAFSTEGRLPSVDDPRVRFVKGWFQNTFHSSLEWLRPNLSGPVLIHFDADLYSSTLFLLTSLWPVCEEYYFIMDDFMIDDIVALHDFFLSFPVEIEFLARREGGVPHSVFGKMKRTKLVLNGVE